MQLLDFICEFSNLNAILRRYVINAFSPIFHLHSDLFDGKWDFQECQNLCVNSSGICKNAKNIVKSIVPVGSCFSIENFVGL